MTETSTGPTIFKFGGSSLADGEHLAAVADLVSRELDAAVTPPVVVVSAMGDVTDRLSDILTADVERRGESLRALAEWHRQQFARFGQSGPVGGAPGREATPPSGAVGDGAGGQSQAADERSRAPDPLSGAREEALAAVSAFEGQVARLFAGGPVAGGEAPGGWARAALSDRILASGEDLSVQGLVLALRAAGVPAHPVDARVLIRTDDRFGLARPDEDAIAALTREHLDPLLAAGTVPVVQGFVGGTADGRTTTLGRGGSDFTATLLGAAMTGPVHIWTDVEGVLSADPGVVESPRTLTVVGFEEAVELAYFGARVLHPGAAKHAVSRQVPVRIRSTFRPENRGTLILEDRWGGPEIAAVASKPRVALIKVRARPTAVPYGFLARVFEILARHRLPVDLVATSHTSTAFTVDDSEEIGPAARELEEVAEVSVRTGLATVTVVGNGLLRQPGFDARVFGTVARTPIHLVSQASDVSLSLVVDASDAPGLVRRLHVTLVEQDDAPAGGAPDADPEKSEDTADPSPGAGDVAVSSNPELRAEESST